MSTIAVSFVQRLYAVPCPRHGRDCAVAGHRGLLLTWACGHTQHADAADVVRVRRATP